MKIVESKALNALGAVKEKETIEARAALFVLGGMVLTSIWIV